MDCRGAGANVVGDLFDGNAADTMWNTDLETFVDDIDEDAATYQIQIHLWARYAMYRRTFFDA